MAEVFKNLSCLGGLIMLFGFVGQTLIEVTYKGKKNFVVNFRQWRIFLNIFTLGAVFSIICATISLFLDGSIS